MILKTTLGISRIKDNACYKGKKEYSSIKNNINCIPRKLSIIEQFKDIKRWKKKHGYGMRWMVESAFLSIKRTFGEYVSSVKWNNIVNELMLKASIYNTFIEKTICETE